MATDMTVSKTIAAQIGGRALFMLGAKNLMGDEKSLTFKVGRGAKNTKGTITHIRITLDFATDTYNMEFLWVRGTSPVKTRASYEGLYADMMHETISEETGMALSL